MIVRKFKFLFILFLFIAVFVFLNKLSFTDKSLPKEIMHRSTLGQNINYPVIFHGSRTRKEIALTFDADMTPLMKDKLVRGLVNSWYNKKIVDVLRQTNTKATFFLTGMWAELYPNETKELASYNLFEIGNHSYSHPSFGGKCYGLYQIPNSQAADEIEKTQQVLKKLTGSAPQLFRFPGGCYTEENLRLAQSFGLKVIQWDVVSGDAFNNNTQYIEYSVLSKVTNGSIVVMHLQGGPTAPKTGNSLLTIINILKKKGYSFVKVSELIKNRT